LYVLALRDAFIQRRIFANLILLCLLLNSAKQHQRWLKSDKYNRHFTLILRNIHEIYCRVEISPRNIFNIIIFLFPVACDPTWAMASSFTRFLDRTQRRVTVGRTPLDVWTARRRDLYRDLYLTTHNTHNR